MSLSQPRTFPPTQLSKFPRMSPQDIPLWRRFLTLHGKDYTRIEYDVRVGQGITTAPDIPEHLQADWIQLTQKRIDAVAHASNRIDIIEVKPRAATTALGQILTYINLYRDTFSPSKQLRAVVITDTITQDDFAVYERFNIAVVVL